jgi:hypothetical protein
MNPRQVARNTLITLSAVAVLVASCTDGEPAREGSIQTIDGVGDFRLGPEEKWVGETTFDGEIVSVELRHYDSSFAEVADFAKEVFSDSGVNAENLRETISRGLRALQWRFDKYDPAPKFSADEFKASNFYIHWNSDNQKFGTIILLEHETDKGRWVIDSYRIGSGTLIWTPKE